MIRLPTLAIAEHCDPYVGCWLDIDRPITTQEVTHCLARGCEQLTNTRHPLWRLPRGARARHVRKIAYFVRHGFNEPVQLDVGVPALGAYNSYFVVDGNHRLASDLYRVRVLQETRYTLVEVSGSIEYAKELGLWGPRVRRAGAQRSSLDAVA
jgi:hypothetical protein